jgi:hypothetical protein
MPSATLHLIVTPKRMLSQTEAAHHCGRPVRRFKIECPVTAVRFANGDLRYDVRDLDQWLDGLKDAAAGYDAEAILAKLG